MSKDFAPITPSKSVNRDDQHYHPNLTIKMENRSQRTAPSELDEQVQYESFLTPLVKMIMLILLANMLLFLLPLTMRKPVVYKLHNFPAACCGKKRETRSYLESGLGELQLRQILYGDKLYWESLVRRKTV